VQLMGHRRQPASSAMSISRRLLSVSRVAGSAQAVYVPAFFLVLELILSLQKITGLPSIPTTPPSSYRDVVMSSPTRKLTIRLKPPPSITGVVATIAPLEVPHPGSTSHQECAAGPAPTQEPSTAHDKVRHVLVMIGGLTHGP